MKKRKKILALLLSTAMVLTMGMTAFAAETEGASTGGTSQTTVTAGDGGDTTGSAAPAQTTAQTCTITAPANGHTYEIYQIFTARYEQDGSTEKMSDVKWGKNGTGNEGSAVEQDVLDALEAVNGKSDDEKRTEIEKYVTLSNPIATLDNNTRSYSGPAGYYLIKDKDGTVTGNMKATPFIVQAVGTLTITPKTGDTPSFEKKIKDINDSENTTYSEWQDSADHDIGDHIPFKLEGTVAGDYASYSTYYFAFHDVEEEGLTFDGADSVKVYVENNGTSTQITSGYTLNAAPSDKCSFEVVFDNLKTIDNVQAGSKIRVEYTSTLNKKAVLGSQGNVNKAQLEYSNNPSDSQHGKSEWDQVIAFTYKVVVNKFANNVSDTTKLAGAEFTLEKKQADSSYKALTLVKSDDGKTFTCTGLDDGEYRLTETKAPQYYNKLTDPIYFKVTADHAVEWNGQNRAQVLSSLTGTKTSGEITFTHDLSQGSLSADVINKSGTTLPETGGIGTTIFYIIGGVLVAGAAVALITRKRMKSSEK